MKKDIEEILNNSIMEKSRVVHLMMEIRGLLDQIREFTQIGEKIKEPAYPTLRFYCDWVLHHKKSRRMEGIKTIMEKINQEIPRNKDLIKNGRLAMYGEKTMEFIYMEALREEMKAFLIQSKLPTDLVDGEKWSTFVNLLIGVLVWKPIENPTKDIEYFLFEWIEGKIVTCIIKFNDERNKCIFHNIM